MIPAPQDKSSFAIFPKGRSRINRRLGFTLIELVMVILLLGLLAAISIPEFVDLRGDARDAATKGGLGGMRSAVAIARAAIALKEDTTAPTYPVLSEFRGNAYNGSHPVLLGLGNHIMDASGGIPQNPWTLATLPSSHFNSIVDCTGITQNQVNTTSGIDNRGWCYNPSNGQVWANSFRNGAAGGATENSF